MVVAEELEHDGLEFPDFSRLTVKGSLTPLSPNTVKNYRSTLRMFHNWAKGRPLTTESAQEFIHYLLEIGKKPNTVSRHGQALRRILHEQGQDPYKVLLPRLERSLPEYLTQELLYRVLAACETPADRAIVMVLVESGLRIGELLALEEQHVRPGWIFADREKTGYSSWVPCRGGAWDALQSYMKWREPSPDGRLFPFKYWDVWDWVKDIGRRAGLGETLHPHILRHTAAMLRREQGASISDIADFLAHVKLDTTRIYERLLPTEMERVIHPVWPEPATPQGTPPRR